VVDRINLDASLVPGAPTRHFSAGAFLSRPLAFLHGPPRGHCEIAVLFLVLYYKKPASLKLAKFDKNQI
jgi:hypothetical protein